MDEAKLISRQIAETRVEIGVCTRLKSKGVMMRLGKPVGDLLASYEIKLVDLEKQLQVLQTKPAPRVAPVLAAKPGMVPQPKPALAKPAAAPVAAVAVAAPVKAPVAPAKAPAAPAAKAPAAPAKAPAMTPSKTAALVPKAAPAAPVKAAPAKAAAVAKPAAKSRAR